jgi:hypothetical protein
MVNQINADSGIRRRSQTFRDLVLDVVSIILLLLVGYFIGRMYAVDPLEPGVEWVANKLSLPAGPPDISGKWDYICTGSHGIKIWGGDANFLIKKERFGEIIEGSGDRTWESRSENSNDRNNISPPIAWTTEGGVFLSGSDIQYHYFTGSGDISEGFAKLHLHITHGEVDRMKGRFSEILKKDPKFGDIVFSRK